MGMTQEESQHVVDIWKRDLLEGEGFLLVSRLPSRLYEAMFLLTITPNPTELTRVGMIFDLLQDQPACVEWLPKTSAHIERLVEQLGDDKFAARMKARDNLQAMKRAKMARAGDKPGQLKLVIRYRELFG